MFENLSQKEKSCIIRSGGSRCGSLRFLCVPKKYIAIPVYRRYNVELEDFAAENGEKGKVKI